MRVVLKSSVPFTVGGGKPCRRAVFEEAPGYLQIQHLPVRNKAFAGYCLDCASPCPELCRVTQSPDETRLELIPVPLGLPETLAAEKTFTCAGTLCSAKLYRRANCYSVHLDSPDYCESFVCNPLTSEVSLEVADVGVPLVCILEDGKRLTVYTCEGDFEIFLSCECSDFSYGEKRLSLRRKFADSRKRYEDVVLRADSGRPVIERTAHGFLSRKKTYPELAPLYFLECLAEGFEEEAREYLDDSMKEVDLETVRAFFGEYSAVRLIGDRIALEQQGSLKFYFFDLEDGKIGNFRD